MVKRLIPTIPEWTKHDNAGRSRGRVNQGGVSSYMGSAKGWCLLCKGSHTRAEPCEQLAALLEQWGHAT